MSRVFPAWTNRLPWQLAIVGSLLAGSAVLGVTYYFSPKYTRVGYEPDQPVPFSHALHAGQLGMDCRYCHSFVEQSGHSNVPSASTCMNCHSAIKANSPLLAPVRASYASGEPVPWVRIHRAPDYVYFNHAVHLARGISCVNCHGNIHEMEVMQHAKTHSMAFCLECHREPEKFVVPAREVWNPATWSPLADAAAQQERGRDIVSNAMIAPPQSCSGCHR